MLSDKYIDESCSLVSAVPDAPAAVDATIISPTTSTKAGGYHHAQHSTRPLIPSPVPSSAAVSSMVSRHDSSGEAHQELEMLVHDANTNCVRSFASCKACIHLSPDSLRLVEDEASRFDVWATNSGSCLDPSLSSSLDHRLRNSHGTREVVVLLLRAVRVNLDYGMCSTSLKLSRL